MDKFLLIGEEDWTPPVNKDWNSKWFYSRPGQVSDLIKRLLPKKMPKGMKPKIKVKPDPDPFRGFMGAVFTSMPTDEDLKSLFKYVDSYRVLAINQLEPVTDFQKYYFKCKLVRQLDITEPKEIINWVHKRLFDGQLGTKLDVSTLEIHPNFCKVVKYNGLNSITINDNFGEKYKTIATYKWGMFIDDHRILKLWPEFVKTGTIQIQLIIYEVYPGNPNTADRRLVYTEKDLQNEVEIRDTIGKGTLHAVIEVKGNGTLTLGALHYRWSRLGIGNFFPGGSRVADKDREEIDFYFNPGDMKPPLNIYFSGWRSAEGFEAFYMMRSFGGPFLLFADPRLDGGAFYLGSEELENKVVQTIEDKLDYLGFTNKQLTMSGMSMGSFGALYYGSKLEPHSIILAKPLCDLGTIASNERSRFGTFATSLDILSKYEDNKLTIKQKIKLLDNKFWNSFDKINWSNVSFYITYMKQDEYDTLSYERLLRHFAKQERPIHLVIQGYDGHHTDNSTPGIIWFKHQYRWILHNYFGRVK